MKKSNLLILLLVLLISGCTSSSSSLTYYMLHSPATELDNDARPALQLNLQQLSLPEYLRQRSLAMQTSSATLHFSNQHVWAEPLDNSIQQALADALLSHGNIGIIPPSRYSKQSPIASLYVKIDDFIASSDGIVLLKGQFWLDDGNTSENIQYFDFRRPMKSDGFEQAVVTMRQLIIDLAEKITDEAQHSR